MVGKGNVIIIAGAFLLVAVELLQPLNLQGPSLQPPALQPPSSHRPSSLEPMPPGSASDAAPRATGSSPESKEDAATPPQLPAQVQPLQHSEEARERKASCPVVYQRPTLREVEARLVAQGSGRITPLFGNHSRPGCRHCDRQEGWAHMCQYKSHGPICPDDVMRGILSSWLQRGYSLPLTLTPCDLWRHLEGRTLWMIGDSMMLDFFKAAFCFMMEFWTTLGPGEWDLQQDFTGGNEDLKRQLTPDWVPPSCVPLNGPATRICYIRTDKAHNIVGSTLPALLDHKLLSPQDLLVVNSGLHYGQAAEYRIMLSRFVRYVLRHRAELPRVIWQQTSAQHFKSGSGEYIGGGPPFECGPIEGFSVEGNGTLVLQWQDDPAGTLKGQWRNIAADARMRAAGIPVIASFNETVTMWRAHRDNGNGYECTHYCHPAAPQLWVANLYRLLEENKGYSVGTLVQQSQQRQQSQNDSSAPAAATAATN